MQSDHNSEMSMISGCNVSNKENSNRLTSGPNTCIKIKKQGQFRYSGSPY